MQSRLLFLVSTNQLLFKSDFLFNATSVVDVGCDPLHFGLSFTQALHSLSILVDVGNVLFHIVIAATAGTTTRSTTTLKALQWSILQCLQSSDLSVNLSDSILVVGNIQFKIGDKVIQPNLFSFIGIVSALEIRTR